MLSVPNPLISSAMARADHPVLSVGDQGLTARQLRDAAGAKAAALVHKGSSQAMSWPWLPRPSLDWVSAYHAVGWLGAIVAPLPSRVPAAEVNGLVRELRPRLVLADDRWLGELRNGVGLVTSIWANTSGLAYSTRTLLVTRGGARDSVHLGNHRDVPEPSRSLPLSSSSAPLARRFAWATTCTIDGWLAFRCTTSGACPSSPAAR